MALLILVFAISLGTLCSASIDEYMTCDRYFENKRSARVLEQIPCDMTKKGYCEYKGDSYPEAEIWRFKEENRALMRRLYGDMESNSVYREMRSANLKKDEAEKEQAKKVKEEPRSKKTNNNPLDPGLFSSLEYNIRLGSGLATVQSAREPIVVREHQQTNKKATLILKKKKKKKKKHPRPHTEQPQPIFHQQKTQQLPVQVEAEPPPPVDRETTVPGSLTPEEQLPVEGKQSPQQVDLSTILAEVDLSSLEKYVGEMLPPPKPQQQQQTPVSARPPAPVTTDNAVHTSANSGSVSSIGEDQEISTLTLFSTSAASAVIPDSSPLVSSSGNDETVHFATEAGSQGVDPNEYADYDVDEFEEDDEDVSVQDPSADVAVEGADGDYATEEGSTDSYYTGPSLNACPVKEEVFAPYWANNTRDQVLALLNLYPFEQYIHMETCKYPEEEMMCRSGCRCEQQYRLHRLLAFDPNNECRGIFSDWFRFPSYCICKCYDIAQSLLPPEKKRLSRQGEEAGRQPEGRAVPFHTDLELIRKRQKDQMENSVDHREDKHFFYGNPK